MQTPGKWQSHLTFCVIEEILYWLPASSGSNVHIWILIFLSEKHQPAFTSIPATIVIWKHTSNLCDENIKTQSQAMPRKAFLYKWKKCTKKQSFVAFFLSLESTAPMQNIINWNFLWWEQNAGPWKRLEIPLGFWSAYSLMKTGASKAWGLFYGYLTSCKAILKNL